MRDFIIDAIYQLVIEAIGDIVKNHAYREQQIHADDGEHDGAPVLDEFLTQGSHETAPVESLIDRIHSGVHFEAGMVICLLL